MSPFFVLGNPRSGTSLFRLMLNSHPLITVPPECGFALWLAKKYTARRYDEGVYRQYASDVAVTKKFETWGIVARDIEQLLRDRHPVSYADMAALVYMAYAQKNGKKPHMVGDKNNYYVNFIPELTEYFPQSKTLFMVRDGRDVACSYLEIASRNDIESSYKPKLPSSIDEIAREWRASANAIMKGLENGGHCIRYEDLLYRPKSELARVCSYLGVPYSEEMLGYQAKNDEPEEFLQWKSGTKNKIDPSNIGKFSRLLSQEQLASFHAIAGNELRSFGYR